jgi:hypothetical protein
MVLHSEEAGHLTLCLLERAGEVRLVVRHSSGAGVNVRASQIPDVLVALRILEREAKYAGIL